MADFYELLSTEDDATAQERARALAAALRGREALGMLAASSQNDLINPAGRALLAGAQQGRGMLADAGQQRGQARLRRALESEAARRAEANASRARSWELQDQGSQRAFQAEQNALSRTSQERAAALSAGQRAEAAAKGPNIPASEVANYGGIDAATTMLDGLMRTRKDKTGWASGVMQYAPGTDAAQYSDAQKSAAQTVGLILEGGKLAEGDLSRYMAMLPSPGDSDERAAFKVENIKRMLATKKAAQFKALKAAGYNTGSLTPDVTPVESAAAQTSAAPEAPAQAAPAPVSAERQVVKKQVNRALKKTRLTYADGTTEDVDGIQ